MHVRQLDPKPFFDQTVIEKNLVKKDLINNIKLGTGNIKMFSMHEFVKEASIVLTKNPNAIVVYDESMLESIY